MHAQLKIQCKGKDIVITSGMWTKKMKVCFFLKKNKWVIIKFPVGTIINIK